MFDKFNFDVFSFFSSDNEAPLETPTLIRNMHRHIKDLENIYKALKNIINLLVRAIKNY